jgi:hypothetical protein
MPIIILSSKIPYIKNIIHALIYNYKVDINIWPPLKVDDLTPTARQLYDNLNFLMDNHHTRKILNADSA